MNAIESKSRSGKLLTDLGNVALLILIGLAGMLWFMSLPVGEREKLVSSAFSLSTGISALLMAQPGVYVVYKIGMSSMPLRRKIIWGISAFVGLALVPLALMLMLLT